MFDKEKARLVEAVRDELVSSLALHLDSLVVGVADAASENHECNHSTCVLEEDLSREREEMRLEAERPWEILDLLGVDRSELDFLDAVMPLDLLKHIRRMPRFRALIRDEFRNMEAEPEAVPPIPPEIPLELLESLPPPDMRLVSSHANGRVVADGLANGGQMASVNGGMIVGGGGPPLALAVDGEDFDYDDDPPPVLPMDDEAEDFDYDDDDEPPRVPSEPAIQWTDEQLRALDAIDKWYRSGDESFFSLVGPAGSGKTTLMREAIRRIGQYSVMLTAMTGKAALRLSQCTGSEASTLHKALYYPPKPGETVAFSRLRDAPGGLVLIDEASMMTPVVFDHLQHWAWQGCKMLLVGDAFQLPPVITGDELKEHGEDYSVFAHVEGAELHTVMRSAGGVLRAATRVRESGEIVRESDEGYVYRRSNKPLEDAVEMYLAEREEHMLITWKNSVRMRANRLIRVKLGHGGRLPDEGEPVLIKKNGQGFLNGEIVEAGSFSKGPVLDSLQTLWMTTKLGGRVLVCIAGGREGEEMDGGMPWVNDWKKYHTAMTREAVSEPLPITFGYVLTAHAAQGGEARRATVFLEKEDVRNKFFRKPTTLPDGRKVSQAARWVYTATTRSKNNTTMIVGQ